jgi:hypothetical protein
MNSSKKMKMKIKIKLDKTKNGDDAKSAESAR